MLFKSNTITQASGSVGGTVYSRTKSGMVMKARSVPTNPSSKRQRAQLSGRIQAINWWNKVLTPAERQQWNEYAANVPVVNAIGTTFHRNGQQWFLGRTVYQIQLGGVIYGSPPTLFDRPSLPMPRIDYVFGAPDITLIWDGNNQINPLSNGVIFTYVTKPVNKSVNRPPRTKQYYDAMDYPEDPGDTFLSWSPSNHQFSSYAPVFPQRFWIELVAVFFDQSYSNPLIVGPIDVPA
jgi:hypothetical protein